MRQYSVPLTAAVLVTACTMTSTSPEVEHGPDDDPACQTPVGGVFTRELLPAQGYEHTNGVVLQGRDRVRPLVIGWTEDASSTIDYQLFALTRTATGWSTEKRQTLG